MARHRRRRDSRSRRNYQNNKVVHPVKNHVSSKAKDAYNSMRQYFGIDLSDLSKLTQGDVKALQELGDRNNVATVQGALIEPVTQAYVNIIETTGDYNENILKIIEATARNKNRIMDYQQSAELVNKKYLNNKDESTEYFLNANEVEDKRHDHRLRMMKLKQIVSNYVFDVNATYDVSNVDLSLEVKQRNEESRYLVENAKNQLMFGSESPVLPKREFVKNGDRKSNGWLGNALQAAKNTLGLSD